MPLSAGTKLGPYEIVALIGAGGMGKVYRARDPRMGRDVAIKISAERFSDRFSREVHAVAALNHPNICHLYDVGPDYLVMELVEGPTLAERIKQGAVPLDEALAIAKQTTEALEAAHEKGIVHRDLKPGNIKIRPDGTVKVLDFGLAKMTEPAEAGGRAENSPTLTADAATRAGVILGTAAYMSPEQARGKPVDKRADIWAFGVVLYETLTGERLFEGDNVSDTLIEAATKEPDWERVPSRARALLRRCLEKDPRKRLRDIGDAMPLLEPLPGPMWEGGSPPSALMQRQWLWPGLAAVFAIAALGLGFVAYRHITEETRVLKFSVPPPERTGFMWGPVPAVSPDGRHVAFVTTGNGKSLIWVRDLNSLAARPLPGTEGELGDPFWSPDSRFIAFFADGKLKKIDLIGGPAVPLCDGGGSVGGNWGNNNVILFAPHPASILFRVPAAGGSATPVTTLDKASSEHSHRWPWFLPDGRHFLYTAYGADPEKTAVYLADLDSKDDLKTRRRVLAANSNAVYIPPGILLFMHGQTLMAQPFDAGKALTTGDPVPLAEQVDYLPDFSSGQFSSSQNGVLAYTSGASVKARQLTWFDRSGKPFGTVGDAGPGVSQPAISPDGNTVAYSRQETQTGSQDIWLHDLVRGGESKFTFHSKNNASPVWSPDGGYIAFSSERGGPYHMYRKAIHGVSPEEAMDTDGLYTAPSDWSRDGRYLIEGKYGSAAKAETWVLPLTPDKSGDRKPFAYLHADYHQGNARLSPNGQWLAYTSDETKRWEVYVQTFPKPGGKWLVSTNGGGQPVWSRDGKELYFIGADGKMMAVEVKAGPDFQASAPKPLFDPRSPAGGFDVSKEGRFLVAVQVEQFAKATLNVVVNWSAGLKK